MTRYLFVVPPLAGHINPTVSVGRELLRRGHAVSWSGLPGPTADLLPDELPFLPCGPAGATERLAELKAASRGLRGAAALKFLWEEVLIPLGRAMTDDLESILGSWQPDVVVADQQALAGAAVARRHGVRWATSATTSAELTEPLAALPRAAAWVTDRLHRFQIEAGVPEHLAGDGDLRFSDQLVLVFSTLELIGRDRPFPPHYAFVGPAITDRTEPDSFPWDWLDPDLPHVLVTLGTVNADAGANLFAVAADALAGLPLQAVFVAPAATAELLPEGSDNLLIRERVPQPALLDRMDAVICHAGHNTVTETLACGLPMVVAPIRDDQPIVADQVVRAGAGLRVKFGRVLPDQLRDAVLTVLDDPGYAEAARSIRKSFADAGGAVVAADRLEALAARS